MENSMGVHQKLELELSHDPAIPNFGNISKRTKNRILKGYLYNWEADHDEGEWE